MRGAMANGDRLRAARALRGLTQERLAASAELDVKTVRRAEQGKRLDTDTLARLAVALEVAVHQVIRGGDPETEAQLARQAAVRRWVAAWDAQDMERLLATYHEDAVLHLPGGSQIAFGGEHRGRDAIRRAHEVAWSTCRTVPQRPEDFSLIVSADTVVLQGSKGICLPGGEVLRLWAVQIFAFEGELIAEHRVEYDTLRFAEVLGLGRVPRERG